MLGLNAKRIGIMLDQSGVRFVILKKNKKSWEVSDSGFLPITDGTIIEDQIADPESLSKQIKQWVKKEGLNNAAATISIPTSQIIIRRMRIQTINPKELPQLVELEVDTALHLPFEDPIYDYVKVGTDEESTQLFIYAVPKKLINAYVALFEDAGVKVKAAELSATALARAIVVQKAEGFEETMLISLDESFLEIYMFHDGYPIFMRNMSLDNQGDEDNTGELSSEQTSEITAEISRMLNFYQYSIYEGASRISKIIITGSTEGKQQLLGGLKQSLPETMDVRVVEFASFSAESSPSTAVDEYRVAMGLALHETGEDSINLLPRINREEKLLPLILSIMLIVWILGAAAMGYLYFHNSAEIKANEAKIVDLNTHKTLVEAGLNAQNKQPSNNQTNPQQEIDGIKAHKRDVAATLDNLNDKLPSGAAIRRISYSATQISLTVNFTKIEDTAKYLFDIRALAFISGAKLQSISVGTSGGTNASNPFIANGQEAVSSSTPDLTKLYVAIYELQFNK